MLITVSSNVHVFMYLLRHLQLHQGLCTIVLSLQYHQDKQKPHDSSVVGFQYTFEKQLEQLILQTVAYDIETTHGGCSL